MGEQFRWNPSQERVGEMLRQAVYSEDEVTMDYLFKMKADLESRDETGATPLHIAATQGKADTVQWLLSKRADIGKCDSEGFSALIWACVKGHCPMVKLLLDAEADVHSVTELSGKAPLSICAERGHLDCVVELLKKKAHVQMPNRDGSTALMCAAHQIETPIVAYLLELQALVNTVDEAGWSALMYSLNAASGPTAIEKKVSIDGVIGKRSTTELLLLHGADVNIQSNDGLTPLIIASGQDSASSVRRLLDARAVANLTTVKGQSALLMAASRNSPETVQAIINAGAEVNQANEKKETPLSLANKYGYTQVHDVLKKAGAVEPKGGKKQKSPKKK